MLNQGRTKKGRDPTKAEKEDFMHHKRIDERSLDNIKDNIKDFKKPGITWLDMRKLALQTETGKFSNDKRK